VKTVIFCGREGIPLRGHSQTGTLALPDGDPAVNDGNFRALLGFRIYAGDVALKEHQLSCMRNATYISPKIQNQIVATCGDIIVEDIIHRINLSGFFSVLSDERQMLQVRHSCLSAYDMWIMSKRKVRDSEMISLASRL